MYILLIKSNKMYTFIPYNVCISFSFKLKLSPMFVMGCIVNFLILLSMFVPQFMKGENDVESHSCVFLMF